MNSYLNDESQVSISYLQHAKAYVQADRIDQAIFQVQMAKKYA
jgi:hypothetical protein